MQRRGAILFLLSAIVLTWPLAARAEDYVITLKDHQFAPADLVVPAHEKITLLVKNAGPGKAEFESADLEREKSVDEGGQISVSVGPLDAGTYSYFDDYHDASTGTITAK